MIRHPPRSSTLWREMLPPALQYLAIGQWTLRFSSGHPFCTYCITVLSVSSFFSSQCISSNRWFEAGKVTSTAFTEASTSSCRSFHDFDSWTLHSCGDRDSESAVYMSLPGTCEMAKSNLMSLILKRCICTGISSIYLVENNGINGL